MASRVDRHGEPPEGFVSPVAEDVAISAVELAGEEGIVVTFAYPSHVPRECHQALATDTVFAMVHSRDHRRPGREQGCWPESRQLVLYYVHADLAGACEELDAAVLSEALVRWRREGPSGDDWYTWAHFYMPDAKGRFLLVPVRRPSSAL